MAPRAHAARHACEIGSAEVLAIRPCLLPVYPLSRTTNLRTKIVDFRGFDSSRILVLRGGIPRPTGNFPGKFESSNLSRDNVSREIGRKKGTPGIGNGYCVFNVG